MVNTLSDIMPKILASGLMNLRKNAYMLRLVNTDYGMDAREFGDTIDVPVPVAVATSAVTPSSTPTNPSDLTPTKVAISLNKWQKAGFHLSDKDKRDIDANRHFLPMESEAAITALAEYINAQIWTEYYGVGGFVDNISNGAFYDGTSYTHKSAVDVRKVLNEQLCPEDNLRRLVLNHAAGANALMVGQFVEMQKSGDTAPAIRGAMGTKFGFDFFEDHQVPVHTAGTITTGLDAKAATAVAVGATSFVATTAASTGACALKKGDVITIAGHTQTYALTADATQASAATDVTLNISPGLKTALTGGEDIAVKASHAVNMAFHRNAFALAMRPLASESGLGSEMLAMQDPKTGIILRLERLRQHKREVWEFDVLFGVKLVRPELAARILGPAS